MEIQTHPHCPYIYLDINVERKNLDSLRMTEDVDAFRIQQNNSLYRNFMKMRRLDMTPLTPEI